MALWHNILVRLVAVALLTVAFAVPSLAQDTYRPVWEDANLESLSGFLKSLGGERYTNLIFKRISRDLGRGDLEAIRPLVRRFYEARRAAGLGEPAGIAALLHHVGEEAREAVPAGKKAGLEIPEYMVEPFVDLVRRVALATGGLGHVMPSARPKIEVPEQVLEPKPEPKSRVENTGLFRDAVDMVQQPHLLFLAGGDDVTSKARVLAELMRLAFEDNLDVDALSVESFADRLVEEEVVLPDERDRLVDITLTELGFKDPGDEVEPVPEPVEGPGTEDVAPEEPAVTEPDDTSPQDSGEQPAVTEEPQDAEEATPQTLEAPEKPEGAEQENRSDAAPPSTVKPRKPVAARRKPIVTVPPTSDTPSTKGDLLLFVEAGAGITVPTARGDLTPVGQRISFDPGVAGRFGGGVTWLHAVGGAHLSFGLFGVLGETNPDVLSGVPAVGSLNVNGSSTYFGVLPYVALELPVSSRVNIRVGGGIGVAHRDVELFNSGARIVRVDGSSLLAQIGGGVWTEVAPCVAFGVDVFATHLGAVRGTGIGGARVRLDGTWDVAATASVRFSFTQSLPSNTCSAFGP